MTVLLLMPLAKERGGAEIALGQLLQHARGVNWHLVFFEDGPMVTQTRELGFDATVVAAGRLRNIWRFGRCVTQIAALARRIRCDVVFSWMPKAQLYGSPAAFLTGTRAGWFQHGLARRGSLADHVVTLLPAAGTLACSRTAAAAQDRLWPRRNPAVVYPPVDMKRFDADALPSPAEARKRLALPPHGPLIGIVGRLQRWKGFHVLVEAMPDILASHPDARCVLVGGDHPLEPDYRGTLRKRITALRLDERVVMPGFQAEVPLWMAAMDVVVHASDREPFGMVVVEAMALGKAVVAGAAGGPAEVITPGVDGLLAPANDANALAAAVLRYLDDPAFARRVGQTAKLRAAAFSADRFAREVTAAIQAMACRAGRRPNAAVASPVQAAVADVL
jgi:glycosyltransferase involved in cell wall biosynthesis